METLPKNLSPANYQKSGTMEIPSSHSECFEIMPGSCGQIEISSPQIEITSHHDIANKPDEIDKEKENELKELARIINQTDLYSSTTTFKNLSPHLSDEFQEEINTLPSTLSKAFKNIEAYNCYEQSNQDN